MVEQPVHQGRANAPTPVFGQQGDRQQWGGVVDVTVRPDDASPRRPNHRTLDLRHQAVIVGEGAETFDERGELGFTDDRTRNLAVEVLGDENRLVQEVLKQRVLRLPHLPNHGSRGHGYLPSRRLVSPVGYG